MKPMKKLTALALACALGLSACAGPGGASSHSAPRQDFTSVPPGAGSTQEGAPAQAMRYRSMWFSYLEWPMLDRPAPRPSPPVWTPCWITVFRWG
ncbi:MAG: hypothetical protein ACLRPX_11715 [Ruthenibacterium sp.]